MKLDFGAIFSQVVGVYARLPLAQKIAIPVLLVGTMAVIIFVSRWGSRPDYALLFSDLNEADAAAVVEKLKEDKIGYRIRNDGKTVDVTPPETVHEVRLAFAAAGLPRGGTVGYEVLKEGALGRTAFVEQVLYLQALQGELERTIQAIDAVKSVRVHITKPKNSVFVKRDTPPTASVLLRLKPGSQLGKKEIDGIVNLVANSVERLKAENVTVVDSRGRQLNDTPEEGDDMADATRLTYQRSMETKLAKRVEQMLTEILGPGRAVATVSALIDFNRFEKEEESYDPGGTVTRSERSMEESAGLTAEGGVPGVISNLTNDPDILTPPDSAKNSNLRKETVRNYEVSRAVSRTVMTPGKLSRLSVAVLVDGQYKETGEGEELVKEYVPLTPAMLAKIENLVKQAVGFDPTRGDLVTVENIRFFEPDERIAAALDGDATMGMVFDALSYAGPIVVAILFFMVLIRPLVKFLVNPSEAEVDLSRLLPQGIEELEAELEAERSKAAALPEAPTPGVDIEELEELLAENSKFVKENPQQAALLIRYWLNDVR